MERQETVKQERRPHLLIREGRLWFTREMERRIFFVLTLIMLAAGLLAKLELWQ